MSKRVCGCGRTDHLREIVMSDGLWTEFFSTPDAIRPETVLGCPSCVNEWQRFTPLTEVKVRETPAWITQKTFPDPEPEVEEDPVRKAVLELASEIDNDLALLARHEHAATKDTRVADRATRRLIGLVTTLGYAEEE